MQLSNSDLLTYMRTAKRSNANPLYPFFVHSGDLHAGCAVDKKPYGIPRVITERILSIRHVGGYFYKVKTTRRTFYVIFNTKYLLNTFGILPEAGDVVQKSHTEALFFGKKYTLRELGYVIRGGACKGCGVIFTEYGRVPFSPLWVVELCMVRKNCLAYLFADRFYGECTFSEKYAAWLDEVYPGAKHALETGEGLRVEHGGIYLGGGEDGEEFSDGWHEREAFNFMHSSEVIAGLKS